VRLVLFANPLSGRRTDVDAVATALRRRGAHVRVFDVAQAERAGEAAADSERLVVAGGDGAIGPAARAASQAGVPLAVVPTGTANDFARALALPVDREAALDLAVDSTAGTTHVELLSAGDRPFVNAASAGLSVAAAAAALPLKPALGALAYVAGALWAGLTARPLTVRVGADGRDAFAGKAWQVIVAGTGAFGGGSGLGRADPGDGLLDVVVVPAGSRAGLLRRAWGMRTHRLEHQGGAHHMRARRVHLEVPAATRFNIDGELCRLELSDFASEPPGVDVVIPRSS
jgi:diacylglycerol kinase (ATP)